MKIFKLNILTDKQLNKLIYNKCLGLIFTPYPELKCKITEIKKKKKRRN